MLFNNPCALDFSSLLFPAATAICFRWAAKDDKFCRIALRARSLLATHLTCLTSEKDVSSSSSVAVTSFSSLPLGRITIYFDNFLHTCFELSEVRNSFDCIKNAKL